MSGQYPQNHGVKDVSTGYGYIYGKVGINDHGIVDPQGGDATFVQAWLKNIGYRTGKIGKYINGYKDIRYPEDGIPDPAKPEG